MSAHDEGFPPAFRQAITHRIQQRARLDEAFSPAFRQAILHPDPPPPASGSMVERAERDGGDTTAFIVRRLLARIRQEQDNAAAQDEEAQDMHVKLNAENVDLRVEVKGLKGLLQELLAAYEDQIPIGEWDMTVTGHAAAALHRSAALEGDE